MTKFLQQNSSDYISLDRNVTNLVKFIACIMVAIHHYSQYVIMQDISHNVIYEAFSTQGGYLGVALFFFLSGFGLMKSEMTHHLSMIEFIKKRCFKVYMPVVLVTFFWLPIYYISLGGGCSDYQIVMDLMWRWKDGVLWFIRCLLLLYATFWIYSELKRRVNGKGKRLLILGFMAVLTTSLWGIVWSDTSSISIPMFYLGVVVAEFKECKLVFKKLWVYLALVLLIGVICILWHHHMLVFHAAFNYLFVLSWIATSSKWQIWSPAIPQWIGQLSFDVYLVHMKCLLFLQTCMFAVPLWAFTGLTAVVTLLFHHFRKTVRL